MPDGAWVGSWHWKYCSLQFSHSVMSNSLWLSSLHQVAKVLQLQLQHQSFQWIFRTDFLEDWLVWSCSPRDSQESSSTPQFKSVNSLVLSFLYGPTLTSMSDYWKNHSLGRTFVGKVMSLLFNMLSRLVIAFLPGSKHLLISWLQSPSAVILEPKKMKSITVSIFSPSFCPEVVEPDALILVLWMLRVLSQLSSLFSFLLKFNFS